MGDYTLVECDDEGKSVSEGVAVATLPELHTLTMDLLDEGKHYYVTELRDGIAEKTMASDERLLHD